MSAEQLLGYFENICQSTESLPIRFISYAQVVRLGVTLEDIYGSLSYLPFFLEESAPASKQQRAGGNLFDPIIISYDTIYLMADRMREGLRVDADSDPVVSQTVDLALDTYKFLMMVAKEKRDTLLYNPNVYRRRSLKDGTLSAVEGNERITTTRHALVMFGSAFATLFSSATVSTLFSADSADERVAFFNRRLLARADTQMMANALQLLHDFTMISVDERQNCTLVLPFHQDVLETLHKGYTNMRTYLARLPSCSLTFGYSLRHGDITVDYSATKVGGFLVDLGFAFGQEFHLYAYFDRGFSIVSNGFVTVVTLIDFLC